MKKFTDENGRLFGLINPIDLLIIVIILGIGLKLLSDYRPAPLDLKQNTVTMGLIVKNIPTYLAESVTVGQDIFQDQSNAYLGKIYALKTNPAELLLITNGQVTSTTSPRNYDLRMTLKNKARVIFGPARSGVYFGKLAVRVGDHLNLHTLYSSIKGEVEFLRVKQ